jgi:predicted transcriptional regulator
VNVALLIDSIVRQATVLIAQLATAGGARTPLADMAGQVFRELADELHRQGVSRKVAADMFGMALRTYRRKIQRFAESHTVSGRSLWEAVYEHVSEHSPITRSTLLRRFDRDEELTVKAVLQDLVETGLLYRSGHGADAVYRAVTQEEMELAGERRDTEGTDILVWGAVYRANGADRETIARSAPLSESEIVKALDRLEATGRVRRIETAGATRYESDDFVIPLGAPVGWEAAVFDHFQAVVNTIAARLRSDNATAAAASRIGGSTYSLEVWDGHPLEDEVLGELARFRDHMTRLRARVATHNTAVVLPSRRTRVVIYGGQNLMEFEEL